MVALYILAGALFVFLLSVTITLLVVGPTMLLQPKRRTAEFYRRLGRPTTPAEASLPYEEINVITDDGLKLNSWLIKSEAPACGTLIYLHGVGDCKIDGLRFAKLMHDHHYNVFLYDARRHGASEGTFCTYGYHEKYDVVKIVNYLCSRTDISPGKFGLFGTSMGAAVALQAAALERRIAVVVAENSFATLRTIFDDYQKRLIMLPFHFLRNLVIIRSEFLAKFRASDVSPLDSMKNVRVPILFVYGTDDHLIKHQYSLALYEEATSVKEAFAVENASHTDIWDISGTIYEQKLIDFYRRYLR